MIEKSNVKNEPVLSGKRNKVKRILLPILTVLVVIAGCAGFYYFSMSSRYFSTDNAKVTAKMYTITPNASGELLEWNAEEGKRVEKNAILGRQEVLPYITSPIAGTIVENDGVEGEIVTPAKQLAMVADTDNMYIGVNIEETDINKIKVGQTVDVKIDAYPGKTFQGVVSEIDQTTQTYFSSPTSFSTSGTYTKVTQLIPVKVVLENEKDLPLKFGMNAAVKIHLRQTTSNNEAMMNVKGGATSTKPLTDHNSIIEAADQIVVTTNVSGKVSKVNVKIGQNVKQGDVLFVLDSTDMELQVKQAEANYMAMLSSYSNNENAYNSKSTVIPAQNAYDEAAADYSRLQTLYASGATTKVDLDNAKAKVDTTQAQLQTVQNSSKAALDAAKGQMKSAKAALEIVQKKLDDYVVKAPMSGEVASKVISVGDMASPQEVALTLINASNVKVHINVTEANISKVKIGTKAEIKAQAIDVVDHGSVASIAPACDPKTGLFPVEILVKNADGKLKPGMMTDVTLQLQ
ncbi:efflux RND transporter periplasmic adaptor subunit [Desulfosporosinus sp. BG]|uniref:efflux RND transporter periplasmic adaptor subunit n=1 Tax=Desulfosporosinus sp. BG TaxID=1633135 RepID=UPI00083A58EC|nr:efflux RND transporter periplasmic adaptor subunit [Desulfosporosinus sp. BG]ODA39031.1 Multidrug resistance protein [Desulfosporosinus sp. BG]